MDWKWKLERKFGKFAINGLMNYIIAGQILVFGIVYLIDKNFVGDIVLFRTLVFEGQIWRLLTFVFMPMDFSILWFAISAYFYYFIGNMLENAWGAFRLNLYIYLGIIGAILASFLVGAGTNSALLTSLFLAYAMLYPNRTIMFMMVLEVKVAWLGYATAGFWLYNFIFADFVGKANLVLGMLGFFVFFGPELYRAIRAKIRKEKWKRKNKNNWR